MKEGVYWVIYGHGLTKLVMQVSVNYSCRVPAWLNALQAKNLSRSLNPGMIYTVELPVSEYRRCEDLVVAYGRWSLEELN